MREDLRGSELSVPGSPDVRCIGESRSGMLTRTRETLCVEHPLTLSAAGGQSATREDLGGSEPSVPGSPNVRCVGESRSRMLTRTRETLCVEHPLALVSGRRPVSDEKRSQRKRAECAW
jgi:hypothetical protein